MHDDPTPRRWRRYDLFVSYSREDNREVTVETGGVRRGWVDAFVAHLRSVHADFTGETLEVFFDQHSIPDDALWANQLRAGVRDSILFLAFLSPRFLASKYCRAEWIEYLRFQHANARGAHGIKQIYVATIPDLDSDGPIAAAEAERALIAQARALQRAEAIDLRLLRADDTALTQALAELDAGRKLAALKARADAPHLARFAASVERLDDGIRDRLDQVRLAEIADSYANLPTVYRTFVGRAEELVALHQAATNAEIGVISAVHGLGGQGKTALAVQYAHAYAGFYAAGGRWFLECELAKSLEDAFIPLPTLAGYRLPDEASVLQGPALIRAHLHALEQSMQPRAERLRELWQQTRATPFPEKLLTPRALIVLDNVAAPGFLGAKSMAALTGLGQWLSVIATTRLDPATLGDPNLLAPIPVEDLPPEERLALLREFQPIPPEAEPDAWKLLEVIGSVTIDVEIVAATLQADMALFAGRGTLQDVLIALRERLAKREHAVLEALADKVLDRLRAREVRLSVIVEDTLRSLTEPTGDRPAPAPAAHAVLECATCFAPDSVTEDWLRNLAQQDRPELEDERLWLETLHFLDGRRLLTLTEPVAGLATRRLHRDVGAVLSGAMPPERQGGLRARALHFVDAAGLWLEQRWRAVSAVRPIRRALVDMAQHLGRDTKVAAIAEALVIASQIEAAHGTLTGAIAWIEAAAAALPDDGSAQTRRIRSVINNELGDRRRARGGPGDAEAAERLYRDSLATAEAIQRENPDSAKAKRDVSVSQSKLGDFLRARGGPGDAAAAERLYRASLATDEAIQRENPDSAQAKRDVSLSQERLGDFLRARGGPGDAAAAERLYRASLATLEAIQRENPDSAEAKRDVSVSQERLGDFLRARGGPGDAEAADQFFRSSLTTREAILRENPGSAEAKREIAVPLLRLGEVERALALLEELEAVGALDPQWRQYLAQLRARAAPEKTR